VSLQAQVIADSILIGKNYRSFYFDPQRNQKPGASLVFVLHGSGGTGLQMRDATSILAAKQEQENFLLVFPNGYKRYWNECRKMASSLANKEDIDEESFFISMIKYFSSKYKINEDRVFAMGTSGGGHMSYKLAMSIPGKIKAITAIIANLPANDNMDCMHAKEAVPVMIINGTEDPLNKYEGGMMKSGSFIMGKVRSSDQSFQYWAELAGYKGKPVMSKVPDNDPADGKTIERYTYNEQGKPEIVLLKVIGGKHDYPNDIDVHVEGWEFFKRQL
jgi:polyhydroxybutyrate depolymerase